MNKRVVLVPTTGAYRGLHQIVGLDHEMCQILARTTLPDFLPEVPFLDHVAAVNLIKVTHRYVLYRELIVPALAAAPEKPFHPAQV